MGYKYSLEPAVEGLVQKVDDPSWVGFDLDGTVAGYDTWKGWDHIGPPIPKMINLIKDLLNKGIKCKILTARASKVSLARNNIQLAQMEKVIQDWTEKHIGVRLPVVTEKDCYMVSFYDDKCVQVQMNTGDVIGKDITLEEYAKKNHQCGDAPEEVEPAEVDQQTDWNQKLISENDITLVRAGIVEGGFKSCELPPDWRGSQWLVDATSDNTQIRVAINTMKGIKNNVEGWFIVCDIYVAAGSNRIAFVFKDNVDFKAIGKIISERTLSKVTVKM